MIDAKKKRVLLVTLPLILAPILYGLAVYKQLPAQMITHWGMNNEPNGYMSRAVAVFGLPALMAVLQTIMVLAPQKSMSSKRFNRVAFAIIPVISVILYVVTIQVNLGQQLNIWRIVVFMLGLMFVALGNYMPTVPANYGYGWNLTTYLSRREGWARVRRVYGYTMVGGGILLLLSLFFTPLASAWTVFAVTGLMLVLPLLTMKRKATK